MATIALTGPAAAAHLELDGFRGVPWPSLWCVPLSGRSGKQTIRVRQWIDPIVTDDLVIAHPLLVLRHLGEYEAELGSQPDRITARDRIELAVEHALRLGWVDVASLRRATRGGRTRGDQLLREVLALRGDEPPAESFAEVRAIQQFREWGLVTWRQIPVYERGRLKHRVDLVIALDETACRPAFATPECGLLAESDSREFHEHRFEEDHARQTTYDMLGLHWISFTPTQLARNPSRLRMAIERRLDAVRRAQSAAVRAPAQKTGRRRAA